MEKYGCNHFIQVLISVLIPLIALGEGGPSKYRQISNIRHTLVGIINVDHSDVVGALPVGAAPTTYSFTTYLLVSMDWAETTARRDENHLSGWIWCVLY